MSGSQKELRCAVVGVGYLGRFHAQKFNEIDGVKLIGVSDLDSARGQEVAKELGVDFVESLDSLIGEVDAVTVASSTSSHYDVCKKLLSAGIHVNVEKPMTSTSKEGEELCQIAEEKDLKFQVGHVERFNPALIAAREKMNQPLFIECHRLAPFKPRGVDVNVVLDLMIHDLDVILSLVKTPVAKVSAVGTPVLTKTVDIANARVEFESGATANITASRVSQNAQRKFRVFQKDQYLSVDFGSGEVGLLSKTGDWKNDELPLDHQTWNLDKGDALMAETQAFVDSIRNNTECLVTGRDGLRALTLAERIIEDIEKRLK